VQKRLLKVGQSLPIACKDCTRLRPILTWDTIVTDEQSRIALLKQAFAEAGIGSSAALGLYVSALYQNDDTKFSHAARVASISAFVAASLGLPTRRVGDIERAGLLHDIGILLVAGGQKGPLSPEELGRAQIAAYDAMIATPFLAPAAEIVCAARERYDGKGWPYGLAGHAIPLGARIVALAETFDSLVFTPDLRDAASVRLANAELVRHAGFRLDSRLIRVWLRALIGWCDQFPELSPRELFEPPEARRGASHSERPLIEERPKRPAVQLDRIVKRRIQCS
jgi:response regulator RpfG family c-di-GMP phosphodiesterase